MNSRPHSVFSSLGTPSDTPPQRNPFATPPVLSRAPTQEKRTSYGYFSARKSGICGIKDSSPLTDTQSHTFPSEESFRVLA